MLSAARAPKAPPPPPTLDSVISPLVDGDAAGAMGRELEQVNQAFVQTAVVTITDARSYQEAARFLQALAAKKKQVVDFFAPMKSLANRLHKTICSRENALLLPLNGIDQQVRGALVAYDREQDRLRRAEEQRLAEQARQDEERRLLDEAAHLERQGQPELAAAVVQQALDAPAPVITIASQTPHVAGVSTGEAWAWSAVNGDEARAVELLAKTGNHAYLTLDTKKLAAYARMHKAAARLPGIQFTDAGKVIVRS